jgi:hypothetical protein
MFENGKFLRNRYDKFLGQSFKLDVSLFESFMHEIASNILLLLFSGSLCAVNWSHSNQNVPSTRSCWHFPT